MPSPLHITVNGETHQVDATPDTPLLTVLRNDFSLNAAKYGCGFARCGACSVHIDGELALSCVVPIGDVAGHKVVTLEGLASSDALHPLQQAILDEQAAQCGYCTPGIIMTAAALLRDHPDASDMHVREALDGTLCRCGSHPRILKAIRRVIDGGEGGE